MNYLVVGAGNARRSVARFPDYFGHNASITDLKEVNAFKSDVQRISFQMGSEGIKLDLGNQNPVFNGIGAVYVLPNLVDTALIDRLIKDSNGGVLTNEDFSKILNNLVSEAIIDGIVKGKADDYGISIFELLHGTIGLLNNLNIKIGLLTNIAEEHLSEFCGFLEKYQQRKRILDEMSETFTANYLCYDIINPKRNDALYYALDEDVDFKGIVGDKFLTVEHNGETFTMSFYMMSYFFENSVAASAVALTYGVKKEDITDALTVFKGLPAHVEDAGDYNGRKLILDSTFVYDVIKIIQIFCPWRYYSSYGIINST